MEERDRVGNDVTMEDKEVAASFVAVMVRSRLHLVIRCLQMNLRSRGFQFYHDRIGECRDKILLWRSVLYFHLFEDVFLYYWFFPAS